jgi:precorrin-6B methylase 2
MVPLATRTSGRSPQSPHKTESATVVLATFLVTKLCLADKAFIDVGAHIGSIISEVIQLNASIKIIAVEAIPEKIAKLRKKFPNCRIS